MIVAVESAEAPGRAPARVTGREARGIVARSGLWERLETPARATVVCGPPGSGKTILLRSWIDEAGLAERAAWVTAGPDKRDPQSFWLSVLDALCRTSQGSSLVHAVTTAPDLDGWVIVERMLTDLALLEEPLWLVIDDVHDLGSGEALRQLELLIMRAPQRLRFVLATRHDVRLGLHRLRLEGELTEIRADDLRFSVAEARELFRAAGVGLPELSVTMLHERTEGWAAGLRLAALSLAGHPDPERFAAAFSGSDRTVAEYLLAEVLDRQSDGVRRLLLRTSVLERVNGELADLLTGGSGGERMLQDLVRANAFVASVDTDRSWFRYHQLFAGLLRLELRRTEPTEVAALHRAAAGWFAGHGYPVEAIRHAQAARDWDLAVRLLADHWPGLHLDGHSAAIHELLGGFPAGIRASDAELAAVAAADELSQGSLEAAEHYLRLAEQGAASIPEGRQGQARRLLGVVRLLLARQLGNLPEVIEQARLLDVTAVPDPVQAGLGEDLRALGLISLGTTELRASRFEDAQRHLERGVALAQMIERPFLEFSGLAHQTTTDILRSSALAMKRCMVAVELAQRHGWSDEPAAGIAYKVLAAALLLQGQLEEAERWLQRAEGILRAETEPVERIGLHYARGVLDLARGRDAGALAAFQAAERLAERLGAPNHLLTSARAFKVQALVRLDETARAEQAVLELAETGCGRGEVGIAVAVLRLAQADPHAAVAALGPVLDRSVPVVQGTWLAEAFVLEAIVRDALGDPSAVEVALEHALDLAEPDGELSVFLLHPAPGLLERHARHRTAHASLIAEIQSLLAGRERPSPSDSQQPLLEPVTETELRVLRYLPTNLSVPEIAGELHVSRNTVKTHTRNLYAKLGASRRAGAVERARVLGLLAPSARLR